MTGIIFEKKDDEKLYEPDDGEGIEIEIKPSIP
jgi:hypothetical protein